LKAEIQSRWNAKGGNPFKVESIEGGNRSWRETVQNSKKCFEDGTNAFLKIQKCSRMEIVLLS
jgi:hypothetical protein